MQIRTADLLITNELLYQLSYTGILPYYFILLRPLSQEPLPVLNMVKFYIIPAAINSSAATYHYWSNYSQNIAVHSLLASTINNPSVYYDVPSQAKHVENLPQNEKLCYTFLLNCQLICTS